MARPDNLPDFTNPPFEEAVLGVQFTSPVGYSSVYAKDIWGLYKNEFPTVQEQPALEQQFETFGGVSPRLNFKLKIGSPPVRGRLWFVSREENHLIQFQEDRLLLNWRKAPNGNAYPRFESIAPLFQKYLSKLDDYFNKNFGSPIDVNQVEISYHNILPVKEFSEIGDWLRIWNDNALNLENINTTFNEEIQNSSGSPYARLYHEIQSQITIDGKNKALGLVLTFRGAPDEPNIPASMQFFEDGRSHIVNRFAEITTDEAHKLWEKLV